MVEAAFNGCYDMINSRKEEILFCREDIFGWYCEKVAAIGPYEIMKYNRRWMEHHICNNMIDQGWLRSKIVHIGFYEMMNIRNPLPIILSW